MKNDKDAKLIQNDQDILCNWYDINKLFLNILILCKIINSSKKHIPQIYNYNLNDIELTRIFSNKDLDIYFYTALSFNDHYANILHNYL